MELPLTHPELYEDIGIKPPKVRMGWGVWAGGFACGRWKQVTGLLGWQGCARTSASSRPRCLWGGRWGALFAAVGSR